MKTFYLPATESDLQLLAELLREARQQPFQFHNCDREERIIELEKKLINPTREYVDSVNMDIKDDLYL